MNVTRPSVDNNAAEGPVGADLEADSAEAIRTRLIRTSTASASG